MSLAVLANHMATKGRHGDDMLVHMSKDEVAALQRLAEQHGLTLTINPETGLPEAFSLKSLLKTVAPLALGWALGPAGFGLFETSLGASLAVGGIGALATGSLEKGLMMGLSAYGGSELGGALKAAGAAATPIPVGEAAAAGATVSPEASLQAARAPFDYTSAITQAPAGSGLGQLGSGTAGVFDPNLAGAQLTTPFTTVAQNIPTGLTQAQAFSQLPVSDQISNIYKGVSAAPGEFLKSQYKNIGLAALPAMMAAQPSGIKGIGTDTDPSKVRFSRFAFDPLTRTMVRVPGFSLADYRAGIASPVGSFSAADGGIVALANGGVAMTPSYQNASMSPGMLDFAGRSEPVVRMADGGATREDVLQAYANTPGAVANPDEQAINYWMGAGLGGFQDVVNQVNAAKTAAVTKPGQDLVNTGISGTGQADLVGPGGGGRGSLLDTTTGVGAQTVATQPTQSSIDTVTNIYRNVLGRDPDAVGLNYWAGRLAGGESIDSVLAALKGSAQTVLGANAATLAPGLSKNVAQATAAPTGYVSSQGSTIGDEWIRNTLGREPNAADMQQPWYQALNKLNAGTDVTAAYSAFQQWAQKEKAGVATPASWFEASQLLKPKTATTGPVIQPPGTQPPGTGSVIPGAGTVPTMQQVVDAYTKGGGSLGYIPYAPKTEAEMEARYPLSGVSKDAYDYLMGKAGAKYPVVQKPAGGISQAYWKAAGMEAPKYGSISKTPTTGDTTIDTSNINPNAPAGMQAKYDAYWDPKSFPVGNEIDWAGGKLKKLSNKDAIFTYVDESGKTQTLHLAPTSRFEDLATNPLIADYWKKEFGYDLTKHASTPPQNQRGDTGGAAAAGGLMALKRYAEGGYAEGGAPDDSQGFYDEQGNFRSYAPANSGIAAAVQATVADSQVQGAQQAAQQAAQQEAATQGLAALNAGTAEKSALSQAGYNAQTDTTMPAGPSDEVKNYLDWWATQTDPLFGGKMGDKLAAQGKDLYGAESVKFAQDQLDRAKANATVVALNKGFPSSGFIASSSDPTSGATLIPRPDGSTDVYFPDGTQQHVAPNIDPYSVTQQYKGPTTGNYGVNVQPTGEWTNPNWRSLYALELANQDKQRVEAAAADRMYGRVAGPSMLDPNAALPTQDPLLAQIIGNLDTVTVQRALNLVRSGRTSGGADPAADALAAKLKSYALPQSTLSKLIPSRMAGGGHIPLGILAAAAEGGQFDLGGYSDGGRLLKGPGDGVSDSIPATIGGKRPARLADGEFVVPARIVSELGNGSTDAGARKLYAMMDRIQANRSKTTGKGKVAVNSRADKYLPA